MFPLQGGMPTAATYVDDVFSTYLYTANNSTQTITNGIDLAGKGGMVWIKGRTNSENHAIFDTVRGATKHLSSNTTLAETTYTDTLTAFNSTGFTLGADASTVGLVNNGTTINFASWTFRRAPKFFDVVTYTGDGTTQSIAHSLGIQPGLIIIKATSTTGNWTVWARGGATAWYNGFLNSSGAMTGPNSFDSVFTSSTFLNSGSSTAGVTYVAYLFAQDTSTSGLVQCGSFTTDVNGDASVTLGWEPQFLMLKASSATANWAFFDMMRGWNQSASDAVIQPTLSVPEFAADYGTPTATGFDAKASASTTYIYVAIRRPNKPPTLGTQVFTPIARTGSSSAVSVTGVGFPPDLLIHLGRSALVSRFHTRLAGVAQYFVTNSTAAETTSTQLTAFTQNGFDVAGGVTSYNANGTTYVEQFFKRAPGFFEQVCYTGAGSMTVPHNLGVLPGFVLTKRRNAIGSCRAAFRFGVGNQLVLESNAALANPGTNAIGFTETYLELYGGADTSLAGGTYISYLFGSFPGISSISTYTGNGGTVNLAGTSQTINCGFSAGARFVLIKRTDSTGDWYVFDTARGIVAAADPYTRFNVAAAEVTTADVVDSDSGGFIVNQTATENLNVTGASYAYFAIA